MKKISKLLLKYKQLLLIFLTGLVGSYLIIILLEQLYSGARLVLFICIPTIYGLMKVKNEKVTVLLTAFLVVTILSLIFL